MKLAGMKTNAHRRQLRLWGLVSAMLLCGNAGAQSGDVREAANTITADGMMKHIRVLASDEFEGRAPGTPGEEKSVGYLVKQFQAMGLKPGNPDGTFVQDVPLVGFTARPTISFTAGSEKIDFKFPNDAVVWSRHFLPDVKVKDCPVVFVGYGVVAPEYGWDDYKGVDVRGKTLLMLINDPPVPDPNDPEKLDPKMFKGREMTYYGRWTYKYEIAAAKGAKAAIIVHLTGPAGYPWGVVMISNGRENFGLQTPDATTNRVAVEGWVTLDNARKMVSAAGADFDALKKAAVSKDFRPVELKLKSNIDVKSTIRKVASRNVVARVEGTDPKLKDEYVIYTAHWDHLGRDPKLQGDQIYNGAVDNASGTAALLEIAKAYTNVKPKRSVLFLAVTAEEKGLLGSKYYAEHPLYPLKSTLADFNVDTVNVWGRTHDVGVVGMGQSTLEDLLAKAVKEQGRVLVQEADPTKGHFFRSDHFEFAKVGVPALYLDKGGDYVGKPKDYGAKKRDEYVARDYHQVSDEIKSDWDLSGAAEDMRLMFDVGWEVANGDQWPRWKEGSEFKARRDQMMVGK
jgi:Zn-dependent M28 family amino/carboxypeptidase